MQANCHPDHDPHGPLHASPQLEHMHLCSESLFDGQNHDNGFECFCNSEGCIQQVLNYVYGHTNPPPDKDFVCDTYACNSNEICRINNVGGAIRGQCMDDPGRHGIIVRFGCPFFLRAGQECYCNSRQCVNDARAVTTTSTTTTTTAPPPSGVPTFHPLCVDQDTRCALFKDRLCHATTQAYAIATCARTCNFCDQYIARASTIQQTTSTTNTPTTVTTTTKPTTTLIPTNPTTATSTTGPAKCNTCGDIDNYIPCFSRDVFSNKTSVCPAGHNFCMTDIYTDADGNADLFKRCVTEQTCNTKWTNDSAKFDYCRKYGVVANDNAYECHFCCTGDGCNTSIKPSDSTLVVPTSITNTPTTVTTTTKPTTTSIPTNPTTATSTTGPAKCNTCGDIDNYIPCFSRDVFSNKTSVCPAGHNFCMTDIYTDADGNADLFKRCVTEQTCNTKWTDDSAKFDYCRKYGVVANDNAYECHFCCTGNGCNTSIKPSDSTLVVPHAFLIVGK
ncbi:unnamed protein product [Mytilus edulis]|uniref:ShKT domain-containing protein n=1 Tax=Mytilus edulis TaxID=6550 RepID=A0A8S3RIH1_MYTED|nr:unnamed protein product [Mytilus edulis]